MVTFLPLGGADDIGASCYFLDLDGTGIVLDCGTHPRKTGSAMLPQFDLIAEKSIDAVLISHAHQDHLDALPYLVQKHPYVRIVTTPQTRAIAELTLHNSVRIVQEELKNESVLCPYSHEEIDLLIQSIEWKSYTESFPIAGYRRISDTPIDASFYDAGHILGSAGILLEHNGKSIYYTGDISINAQTIFPGAALPQHRVDVLILECTHGATEMSQLPSRNEEQIRFAKKANQIFERGGAVLIPVFALGKMQEVLAMIWNLMEQGRISRSDIFTGGVGKKISSVYDKNRFVVPYNDSELLLTDIPQYDVYDVEQIDDLLRRPCFVLASSGMMIEETMSFKLAKQWLNNTRSAIFTVGYMDPETPGFRVRNAKKGDLVQLTDAIDPTTVRCDIEQFRFSAHSDREGLLHIVDQLHPSTVILIHGEHQSVNWMGETILTRFPDIKVHAAQIGRAITLFE